VVKLEAAVPPNLTVVRFVKFVPVMVTVVPVPPVLGLKSLMVGGVVVALEILICPLVIVGFKLLGGLLLSYRITFESVKVPVPLAPLFAVICSIYTLPVPVGPGATPVLKLYPFIRLIDTKPLEGNVPVVLFAAGALGNIPSLIKLFCCTKALKKVPSSTELHVTLAGSQATVNCMPRTCVPEVTLMSTSKLDPGATVCIGSIELTLAVSAKTVVLLILTILNTSTKPIPTLTTFLIIYSHHL
jgi:hypothetical protein